MQAIQSGSPDGIRLACSVSLKPGEDLSEKAEEKQEEKKLEPFIAVEMKYKSDSAGLWDGTYKQVAIVNVEGIEAELLTKGKTDYQLQCWSPDGKSIVLAADVVRIAIFRLKVIYYYLKWEQGNSQKLPMDKDIMAMPLFHTMANTLDISGMDGNIRMQH